VLVDVRDFAGRLRPMENFTMVNDEFGKFRGRGVRKVSILDSASGNNENMRFVENLARNRGFNLHMHTDMESAVGWLVEDTDEK
jgi:hypothetical protein